MNYKLLIITFSWLATIGGLFLFSPKESGQLSSNREEQANILQTAIPTSTPFSTLRIKPSITNPTPAPLITQTPEEVSPTTTVLNTTTVTTTTLSPPSSTTTSSTTTSTTLPPAATTTPPTTSQSPNQSQHIFYTSSHWKAKYYYCDTDNDWKTLSPTYLKTFYSEQELLQNYSRVPHEPCKK